MQTPSEPTTDDAWTATVAAAALKRGAMIHRASMLANGFSLLIIVGVPAGLLHARAGGLLATLALIGGTAEFALAARIAFDADLFAALARRTDLAGFDKAMTGLGLMSPAKAGRPMTARAEGAMRLLRRQTACLAGQAVCLLLIGLVVAARGLG